MGKKVPEARMAKGLEGEVLGVFKGWSNFLSASAKSS